MSEKPNTDLATILVDHYQKTYELTMEMWRYRNQSFLYLVGSLGLASFLLFEPQPAKGILVNVFAGLSNITYEDYLKQLPNSFPYAFFESALLAIIFYFMVNLYHRSHYVLRNYRYLNELEKEIRSTLQLPHGSTSFTREGEFYWKDRPRAMGIVKYCYVLIIGGLLSLFYHQKYIKGPVNLSFDHVITVATFVFFGAYVWASFKLDSKEQKATAPDVISRKSSNNPSKTA